MLNDGFTPVEFAKVMAHISYLIPHVPDLHPRSTISFSYCNSAIGAEPEAIACTSRKMQCLLPKPKQLHVLRRSKTSCQ
jgi:hypothetical protein